MCNNIARNIIVNILLTPYRRQRSYLYVIFFMGMTTVWKLKEGLKANKIIWICENNFKKICMWLCWGFALSTEPLMIAASAPLKKPCYATAISIIYLDITLVYPCNERDSWNRHALCCTHILSLGGTKVQALAVFTPPKLLVFSSAIQFYIT